MRLLFLSMYRHPGEVSHAAASDALGFGVTCSDALVQGLRQHGVTVDVIGSTAGRRTVWIGEVLTRFEDAVRSGGYDAVLAFHAFWPFTADLRRILDDAGRHTRLGSPPLVTYTHGSHWDETDGFRHERYPALRWADLGNLLAADRVLVVSSYMREAILRGVSRSSQSAARELRGKLRVVGLPLDLSRIDAAHRPKPAGSPTIVFNHAPIAAKRPEVFLDVAAPALAGTNASILMTRHIPTHLAWSGKVAELADRFPGRLIFGNDMPIDAYFAALWSSRIQVSTAVHESLGVATLEAMTTENFCLLPRVGSYPEISAGDPAMLYDDVEELTDRLLRAVENPDAVAAVAARHGARVRRVYSPSAIAVAVHEVIAEVGEHDSNSMLKPGGPASQDLTAPRLLLNSVARLRRDSCQNPPAPQSLSTHLRHQATALECHVTGRLLPARGRQDRRSQLVALAVGQRHKRTARRMFQPTVTAGCRCFAAAKPLGCIRTLAYHVERCHSPPRGAKGTNQRDTHSEGT
jgi:glycosyltransferase involved in cell wall biosynthesis